MVYNAKVSVISVRLKGRDVNMPHHEDAECPHCGKKANGRKEIEEKFGYRYENTKPQAWCKKCRNEKNKSKSI